VTLKKYTAQIQKNQVTSQDDVFLKPDPDKVSGMKHGNYDKLNEEGNAPEEQAIINGDIIIGKVTPIQAIGNSNKIFRDSSERYKDIDPGIVDRIWSGITNQEGYEMRKMRIRSERIPNVGELFA
jgi:DNA-directed RNA polymerase II subunit RPB2